jgi:uncharacterized protein (UPF0332 family)
LTDPVKGALERAREDLAAARHLVAGGFPAQAVSRAYYAAFHGAEAALLALGETRSKHGGVLAAFGRLVVRDRGFPEDVGRLLRSLFERRNEADYGGAQVSADRAEDAVRDAERFLGAVESWLSTV